MSYKKGDVAYRVDNKDSKWKVMHKRCVITRFDSRLEHERCHVIALGDKVEIEVVLDDLFDIREEAQAECDRRNGSQPAKEKPEQTIEERDYSQALNKINSIEPGQKAWVIWSGEIFDALVIRKAYSTSCPQDANIAVRLCTGLSFDGIKGIKFKLCDVFASEQEAQAECDRRNSTISVGDTFFPIKFTDDEWIVLPSFIAFRVRDKEIATEVRNPYGDLPAYPKEDCFKGEAEAIAECTRRNTKSECDAVANKIKAATKYAPDDSIYGDIVLGSEEEQTTDPFPYGYVIHSSCGGEWFVCNGLFKVGRYILDYGVACLNELSIPSVRSPQDIFTTEAKAQTECNKRNTPKGELKERSDGALRKLIMDYHWKLAQAAITAIDNLWFVYAEYGKAQWISVSGIGKVSNDIEDRITDCEIAEAQAIKARDEFEDFFFSVLEAKE